jgi:undecaprenyl-diphosphatase
MAMTLFEASVLGVVQGLTEFLPVSSSGHLVIFQRLFGIAEQSITFDIFLHLSTLLAVGVFFWQDILKLKIVDYLKIGVASVPAVVVGLLFKTQIESFFNSTLFVGCALLVTALFMYSTDLLLQRRTQGQSLGDAEKIEGSGSISFLQAVVIGVFQAVAIVPGISRSGATVAGGVFSGLERTAAFRFSFLMVIPVILGASTLQLIESWNAGFVDVLPTQFIVGGVLAFIFGLLSLRLFSYVIVKSRLRIFAAYAFILGVGSIILSLLFS